MENKLFCPKCGDKNFVPSGDKRWQCKSCDFTFYKNVAVGVGGFVRVGKELLFIERGEDPCKGLLDVPGGFIDLNESFEQGLMRELNEELGLPKVFCRYLSSHPNIYNYKNVVYDVLDAFFELEYETKPILNCNEQEVSRVVWMPISEIDPEAFAFPSVRAAMYRYLKLAK